MKKFSSKTIFSPAAAAGFAADHKAQGDRLDFGRLFKVYRDQFPFLVGRAASRTAKKIGLRPDIQPQPR
jgi:hypothetical protein